MASGDVVFEQTNFEFDESYKGLGSTAWGTILSMKQWPQSSPVPYGEVEVDVRSRAGFAIPEEPGGTKRYKITITEV